MPQEVAPGGALTLNSLVVSDFLGSSNGGAILNNASNLGVVGMGSVAPYVAAKHGVIGLTKAAALEFMKNLESKGQTDVYNALRPVMAELQRLTAADGICLFMRRADGQPGTQPFKAD